MLQENNQKATYLIHIPNILFSDANLSSLEDTG